MHTKYPQLNFHRFLLLAANRKDEIGEYTRSVVRNPQAPKEDRALYEYLPGRATARTIHIVDTLWELFRRERRNEVRPPMSGGGHH